MHNFANRWLLLSCGLMVGLLASTSPAAEPLAGDFDNLVQPLLAKHCLECHGPEKPKKGFRVDQLSAADDETASKRWAAVAKRVKAGDMPPKSKPQLSDDERTTILKWVQQRDARQAALQAAQGRSVVRRLNRIEYENTIRDLLGIQVELRDLLPPDSTTGGFDTTGEGQHVSSFLMERYLEAADKALNLAIANTPQPPLVKKRYSCRDTHVVKLSTESVYRPRGDALVLFSSSPWNAITLTPFYPPDRGRYRFRICATAVQSEQLLSYRVDVGPMLMGTKNQLVGYFDAPPAAEDLAEEETIIEFTEHLEARSTVRIQPHGLANAQTVTKVGADAYTGPGVEIAWVDIEGPLHDIWPPESHRRIFGELPQEKFPSQTIANYREVVSTNPASDADRILRDFAQRAFRRPVTDQEVRPLVELFQKRLADGQTFEQAVRVALKQVLVSPQFLFKPERPGVLDDYALASRLSYFLWSTMPDDELLSQAIAGKLHEPAVLRAQVERMLASPRSQQFTENFVGQWLMLRELDSTEPDRLLYPEYDDMLRAAMPLETHHFFNEVLKQDLSVANFVASDFTFLNERLAKHYGVPDVKGHAFRKVPLPPDSHRGGVLSMASVLKVTANGTTTSPVVRGSWVLSRILGTPPEPPPAEVPAIEPDIRGATTIREQLAKHREIESCASCHAKFDPLGFALESYDVIGGYREFYRSLGNGKPVTIDGPRVHYLRGKDVDPADTLPDGRKFANIDELKQLLLADKTQLAHSLAEKLITYSTGKPVGPADEEELARILGAAREKDYGFRTLLHEVVQSRLFRQK
jgi:mono/diheme cytochrome c family protein